MKQELLRKATELLHRWVDNIFGDEINQEHFGLSFEIEKKAGASEYYRYISTEEYAMREAIETEGDVCNIVDFDEVAEEALFNVFARGYVDNEMYVLSVAGKQVHCESYSRLKGELKKVYELAWDLFVPYEDGKATELPDPEEAWKELEESFGDEHDELFKKLGWTDVPQSRG